MTWARAGLLLIRISQFYGGTTPAPARTSSQAGDISGEIIKHKWTRNIWLTKLKKNDVSEFRRTIAEAAFRFARILSKAM